MIIKSSTWNRDSNELYDYECNDYILNKYSIKKNSYVIRSDNQIAITNIYIPILKENYLMNLVTEDKKFFIKQENDNKLSKEKIWLSLRNYNSLKGDSLFL